MQQVLYVFVYTRESPYYETLLSYILFENSSTIQYVELPEYDLTYTMFYS